MASALDAFSTFPTSGTSGNEYAPYLPLLKAVRNGDLEAVKSFIDSNPSALTAAISYFGTVLHVAALTEHVTIMEELVNRTTRPEYFEIIGEYGASVISIAARGGVVKMAELVLAKNTTMLTYIDKYGYIPVIRAALSGRDDMTRYLYSLTPPEVLNPVSGKLGLGLAIACIIGDIYEIALDLLRQHPLLAIAVHNDLRPRTILVALSYKSSAFLSGSKLNSWQKLIYSCIDVQPSTGGNMIIRGIAFGSTNCVAIMERQEKIFSLIYELGSIKELAAARVDKYGYNMLHHAAFLAPQDQLDRVSGAALQMQRELQWFKEVENIVQPAYKQARNTNALTPADMFREEHKVLVQKGEKWMKDTATSCTVVAALIATIMFAAAFTVPGGYNENSGVPRYLHRNSFMVFIVADALSLFSSTTSVLMFLGILTSRYREEDFLKSLPTKLIIGLSTLFFSIATMMITFGATLVILLRERLSWISLPIVLIASIPVTLFALLQFPLLVEIFMSTYGPGIFNKPKKSWYKVMYIKYISHFQPKVW